MSVAKIMFLGDRSVGKSSLVARYTQGSFTDDRAPTKELSLATAQVTAGRLEIKMMILDLPGDVHASERYVTGAVDFAVVCFDLSKEESTTSAFEEWIPIVKRKAPHAHIIVVGCKKDTLDDPVENDYAGERAEECGAIAYLECSAKAGVGIKRLFDVALKMTRHAWLRKQKEQQEEVERKSEEQMKKQEHKVQLREVQPELNELLDGLDPSSHQGLHSLVTKLVGYVEKEVGPLEASTAAPSSTSGGETAVDAGIEAASTAENSHRVEGE